MATPRTSPRMNTTAAAARVNLRDVLRVDAVESFMRNFSGESHRLQELLEVTLCYGIYCVSRNFQLKAMTVDELRSVTNFKDTKSQDFYVRNGSTPRCPDAAELLSDPQQLFNKPAHSWRDGEQKPEILPSASATPSTVANGGEASVPEVFFLPNEALKDKMDEIDFYTKLLGKSFVDVAWTTYSARGSSLLNQQQLHERMTRVDQRKRADLIPETELPVYSFVEFLHAYVRKSIATSTTSLRLENEEQESEKADDEYSVQATQVVSGSREERPKSRSGGASPAPAVLTTEPRTSRQRTTPVPARRTQEPLRSKSFQNVQSKIQPELRAQKEKILRVKKTQAQLMRESLARTRLSEYASRHDGDATVRDPLSVKRMPLDKITPGAAALEIVDDFIRSPLMDKFASENASSAPRPSIAASRRKDPLKQEIYGTAAHDDSFIGVKTPSASKTAQKSKKKLVTRDYSGWLGDFGPQHTKTVKPVWATDATGNDDAEEDERISDEENALPARRGHHQQNQRGSGRTDRFEWKFDLLATPSDARPSRSTGKKHGGSSHSQTFGREENNDDDDLASESDKWSVSHSDASDPVYRWLKSVTP